jgi:hypothetical protein
MRKRQSAARAACPGLRKETHTIKKQKNKTTKHTPFRPRLRYQAWPDTKQRHKESHVVEILVVFHTKFDTCGKRGKNLLK